MTSAETRVFAPAKVNLTLHVCGKRPDGYHDLDSLVVFADVGDWITISLSEETEFQITGPQSRKLSGHSDNLVLQALEAIGESAKVTLDKHLPIQSGIGGGSADAAATLKAVAEVSRRSMPDATRILALGADVPVCVAGPTPQRMQDTGGRLTPFSFPKGVGIVLVNPGVAVSTPQCFSKMSERNNPLMDLPKDDLANFDDVIKWLKQQRNDMQTAAIDLCPEIQTVLDVLAASNAALARMSGSGATCFGLFPNEAEAAKAANRIASERPDWWVHGGAILS